jgi:hypothetical protein
MAESITVVTTAIRQELNRRRLSAFVNDLDDELGPADEDQVSAFIGLFIETAVASASGRPDTDGPAR